MESTATKEPKLRTVLLVDGESDLRDFLAAALVKDGCRVIAAGTSAEAMLIVGHHAQDLNVMVTSQPGVELASRLRRSNPNLKVICLAEGLTGVMQSYLHENLVDAFLQQPLSASEVLEALEVPESPQADAGHVSSAL